MVEAKIINYKKALVEVDAVLSCLCHMPRKNCTRKLTASSDGCCFFCCNAHKKMPPENFRRP